MRVANESFTERDANRPSASSTLVEVEGAASANTGSKDVELLRALAGGDAGSLGKLYDEYAGVMLALATRILGDRTEAEDLVHDLFVEVWQRAASYDEARGSVRTWLLVRLRSRAIDRLRSRGTRRAMLAEERSKAALETPRRDDPYDPARREDHRRALSELEGITPLQRDALELAYFGGLTAREIGERCGVPIGTVKSRIAAGVAALRRALDANSERAVSAPGVPPDRKGIP